MTALVSLVLGGGPLAEEASARCKGANLRPHAATVKQLRTATRCLVNRRRAARDLSRLDPARRVKKAAKRHSRDMVERRFFSHTGSDGSSPYRRIERTGYLRGSRRSAVGENIAWGKAAKGRPRAVVRRWMRSSGHRAVILHRIFRDIGVGVFRGSPFKGGTRRAATYTVDFVRR